MVLQSPVNHDLNPESQNPYTPFKLNRDHNVAEFGTIQLPKGLRTLCFGVYNSGLGAWSPKDLNLR